MEQSILIVDDEKDIVSMLNQYFYKIGYVVYTAINGKEALNAITKNPDIILLDINMPDMNGFTVCESIRNYVSCPIIFLTARVEDCDKIKGFAVGADDYVVKPFSIDELEARVAAHLRREKSCVCNVFATPHFKNLVKSSVPSSPNVKHLLTKIMMCIGHFPVGIPENVLFFAFLQV